MGVDEWIATDILPPVNSSVGNDPFIFFETPPMYVNDRKTLI